MHGLLWDLTGADLGRLDGYEGVSKGRYAREMAEVVTEEGPAVSAVIYIASDTTPGKPKDGYLERIIEAARKLGLPADYLRDLERCRMTDGSSSSASGSNEG